MTCLSKTLTLQQYAAFLSGWEGTPYRDGGLDRQGVDCLRFVVSVLDWTHGMKDGAALSPRLPRDCSQHDPRRTWGVVSWMLKRYQSQTVWTKRTKSDPQLSPGDVVLVRCGTLPGHVLIVGAEPNVLWHSINADFLPTGGCVQRTSLGWAKSRGLIRVDTFPLSRLELPNQ